MNTTRFWITSIVVWVLAIFVVLWIHRISIESLHSRLNVVEERTKNQQIRIYNLEKRICDLENAK